MRGFSIGDPLKIGWGESKNLKFISLDIGKEGVKIRFIVVSDQKCFRFKITFESFFYQSFPFDDKFPFAGSKFLLQEAGIIF